MSSTSAPSSSTITIKNEIKYRSCRRVSRCVAKVNAVMSALPNGIEDPSVSSSSGGSGIMYQFRSKKLDSVR